MHDVRHKYNYSVREPIACWPLMVSCAEMLASVVGCVCGKYVISRCLCKVLWEQPLHGPIKEYNAGRSLASTFVLVEDFVYCYIHFVHLYMCYFFFLFF